MDPMSQATNPHTQRSVAGMVGSMIVIVVLVVAWMGFRSLTSDDTVIHEPPPDWAAWVKAGRVDGALRIYAPDALPAGWTARASTYQGGDEPLWHLALLTDKNRFVGVEESRESVRDMVARVVDKNADQGDDVTVLGTSWQTWTDSGGDYALTQRIRINADRSETVMVVGTAPVAEILAFAETLKTGTTK
ncbi:MAG: hypothetical protein JWQ74_3151 [Marmoricola sp.]|nr:hypothetical protein [Marmoricola sp.]